MNVLLDTHILIWWATNDPQLSSLAREIIEDTNNRIYFSSISVWEVAIKHGKGHMKLSPALMRRSALAHGFELLVFHDVHALYVSSLPKIHNDPFDRALVAQAFAEPMHLLTHDALMAEYGGTVMLV